MSARPRNRTQNQSISAYLDGSLQVDGAARYVIQEPKLSLESCATKRRPAVVISPRLPHRDGLCTVIPMSGAPADYEVQHGFGWSSIRLFRSHSATRAKCDMLATVAFERLDLFRTERDQ